MRIKKLSTRGTGPDLGTERIVKNTGLNVLGLVIPAVIYLVSVPVVIRSLGTDRFGLFSVVLTVFSYFALFDLGLGRSSVKFASEAMGRGEMQELPHIIWTTAAMQTAFGLLAMVIMIAGTPFLAERVLKISAANLVEAKASLVYMAFSLPFAIITPSFRGVLEAGQRFELVNMVKIPTNSVIYLLPLVAAPLGMGLPGIILLLTISRALTLFIWIGLAFRIYPALRKRGFLPQTRLMALFSFSGWNALSSFVWYILVSADRFVISALRGLTEVGYYSAPAEATGRMLILPGSLAMTLFPAFSALDGRGDAERARRLYTRSLKFVLLGLGPLSVGLIALSGFILRIWIAPEFSLQSRFVLQALSLGFLFSALAYVPNSYLQGLGRADLPTKIQLIELAVFIPTLWFGVRRFGANGAAAVCAIRVFLDLGLQLGACGRVGKISARRLADEGLPRSAVALGIYAAALFGAKALPAAPVWIIAATVLYIIWVWKRALSPTERDGLIGLVLRVLGRKVAKESAGS
jgi:O-antigen/teichoic acid export membrane protein